MNKRLAHAARLALLAGCLLAGSRFVHQTLVAAARPEPFDFDEERDAWFLGQRAYPFDTIPDGARHAAFESVRSGVQAMATSTAPAGTWESVGPAPVSVTWKTWQASNGRVAALAISPADASIILAGASTGGILRSTDNGATFSAVSDNQVDLAVGAIAFAPSNPQIVYAGMGSDALGTGVLKSTNAGASWMRISNDSTFALRGTSRRLLVDPSDPNRVLLAQWSQLSSSGNIYSSGLLESDDGGINFRSLFRGLVDDIVMMPSNKNTLLMGMSRVDQGAGMVPGIYRSTDGGATWASVLTGSFDTSRSITVHFAVTPSAPQTVFAFAQGTVSGSTEYHLFISTDSGATWSEKFSTTLPSRGATYMAATDAQALYLGTTDLFRSTDGGTTWTNLSGNYPGDGTYQPYESLFHCDQHAFAFSGNTIYVGNDGGIFRSSDAGMTFASANGSVSLVQFYSIAAHPLDPNMIYGGTQDNGVERRGDATRTWREVFTGDYGPVVFNPSDPSTFFANYVYGTVFRFTQNGDGVTQVASNTTFGENKSGARISFIAPLAMSKSGTLYFGTWRLFKSTNLGLTWSAPGGMIDLTKGASDVLTTIGLSDNDPNVIYTGSTQGRLMISRDGGLTWSNITTGMPNRSVTRVVVAPDGATAYVTYSGYVTAHVFKTTNYGTTWTGIGSNLPDIPVNSLFIDPADANVLYAGTDIGVFRSDSGGGTWQLYNSGMPPVIVEAFTRTADGRLVAGTYGRGAYLLSNSAARRRAAKH